MEQPEHSYTSTACVHGEHDSCRLRCKFCDNPCRCSCHALRLVDMPSSALSVWSS